MTMKAHAWWIAAIVAQGLIARASDLDEFKVKREPVFEFVQKPLVTRNGDQIAIGFESKGFCDVTVAVEDASAGTAGQATKIVRHLASGVLGPGAPEPFEKNAKRQRVVWDCKDDQGAYVDNKDSLTVRVSLGLKPQFERTLFWDPRKRVHAGNRTLVAAAPEGVYAFEGAGVDHLRLFDHEGNYIRTIYPPLAEKLDKFQGIRWGEFPQDGRKLPLKNGQVQATFLTSGGSASPRAPSKEGCAASALAVRDGNRLSVSDRENR